MRQACHLCRRAWNLSGDSRCSSGAAPGRSARRSYTWMRRAAVATTSRVPLVEVEKALPGSGSVPTVRPGPSGARGSHSRSVASQPADTTSPVAGLCSTHRTAESWLPSTCAAGSASAQPRPSADKRAAGAARVGATHLLQRAVEVVYAHGGVQTAADGGVRVLRGGSVSDEA
jgi:hypothetical protein